MNYGSLARRYARALLQIAQEENKVEKIGDELESLDLFFKKSPEIFEAFINRQYALAERKKAAEQFLNSNSFSPVVKNFFLLLLDKNRIEALPDIIREFGFLRDTLLGWARAEVTTATSLTADIVQRTTKFLSEQTKKKVFLKEKIDTEMLGGLLLKTGGTLYDGSLRTEMQRLRKQLLKEIY